MEERLTPEERARLQSIYAPTVVTVPPCDASRSMCVTPEGEIRIYGLHGKKSPAVVRLSRRPLCAAFTQKLAIMQTFLSSHV